MAPPHTRSPPRTPDRQPAKKQRSTGKKSAFFQAVRDRGRASIKSSTGDNWLHQLREQGSPIAHRRKGKDRAGRPQKLSDETLDLILSPSRNPLRYAHYEAQIEYFSLDRNPKPLIRALWTRRNKAKRYKRARIKAPKQWKKETQEQFFASERYNRWLASEPDEVEVKPKGNSITQLYYRQYILPRYADELQEARRKTSKQHTLQEDNDPSYGTRSLVNYTAEFKRKNQIKLLIHPAQSPDLNPIEAIWNMLNLQDANGVVDDRHEPHTSSGETSPAPLQVSTALPLDTFDFMVFHSPTCKLVTKAYARLLYLSFISNPTHSAFTSLSPTDRSYLLTLPHQASLTDKTLEKTFLALSKERFQTRVQPSVNVPTMCGNMYCAGVYGALISLLCDSEGSEGLVGKRVGLYSYGGGLAASFFSLRFRRDVGTMVKRLDLQKRLEARIGVSVEVYLEACRLREEAYGQKGYKPKGDIAKLMPGTYYLTEVDEKYQRSYAVKE
ncbi:MAG: hypothetical protein Q9181_006667 [Wetmoreana brouardii]